MMSAKEDSETLRIETLRERIFFAARDGLAITLYALLSELSPYQQSELLSQVKSRSKHAFSLKFIFYFMATIYFYLFGYISDAILISHTIALL